MRKFFLSILSLLSLIAPLSGYASAPVEIKPTLVAIVDINCPFCRELVARSDYLRAITADAGVNFVYAAIPGDGNIKFAWPEKTYYAARNDFDAKASDAVLAALMASQDFQPLHSQADVVVWLQTKLGPVADWSVYVKEKSIEKPPEESLIRAMRLAGVVGLSQFPTFAIVGDAGKRPYQIAGGYDAPLAMRVKEIEKWLNDYSKRSN